MERYLGGDVHAASVSFAIRSEAGKVLRRDVVETNGQALVSYDALLQTGTRPNLAKLTIARQIAGIVLAMWKAQERYKPERVQGLPGS